MVRWINIEDLERTERLDKETGDTIITYEIKIRSESAIPIAIEKEELEIFEENLKDETLYAFERWFERFMFFRMRDKFDYKIFVDDEFIREEVHLISSEEKAMGSYLVIVNPNDLIDIVGKGKYKELMTRLTRKVIDPDKIKMEFGD